MQEHLNRRRGERGPRRSREADLGPVHPLGREVAREQTLEQRLVLTVRILHRPRERRTVGDDGRLDERLEGTYPPGTQWVEDLRRRLSRGEPHEIENALPRPYLGSRAQRFDARLHRLLQRRLDVSGNRLR